MVLPVPERITTLAEIKRRRPRLQGLSGRQALERYVAAYLADPAASDAILKAMTDRQLDEALSWLRRNQPARAPRHDAQSCRSPGALSKSTLVSAI
jgi:hypothetical protein